MRLVEAQDKNGELLDAAEREGFEVFITADSNLRYQQDLGARRIAVVCLLSTGRPRIQTALGAASMQSAPPHPEATRKWRSR